MNIKYYFYTLFIITSICLSEAQNIVGLWKINEVKVGTKKMTPVAKWTKINKDGTYQSGNGWLQNSEGNWTFDTKRNLYAPKEKNGIIDEFGPFTVEFTKKGMTWLREEEGIIVTVSLKRINKLPKATSDKLIGLWSLETYTKNGSDITNTFDPDKKHYIFIRWDRIYIDRTPKEKRSTGYWHIHGHKPEITFLPHSKDEKVKSWKVVVTEASLKLMGLSDSNKSTEKIYKRIHQFPK